MSDLTAERQKHRDDFYKRLVDAYPDPEDPVRMQCMRMMDRWWPGTVETE